jgi:hypothetical protein
MNLTSVKCEVFKMSKTSHLTMLSPKIFWGLKQFDGNLTMHPFFVIEIHKNANVMVVIAQSPKGGTTYTFIVIHG